MLALLAVLAVPALAAVSPPGPQDPAPLASSIQEVVVYGGSALVRRSASVPGSGRFVVAGLPGGLDPDAVRVRLSEGSVASVEVNDRHALTVPDARRAELQAAVDVLLAERRAIADEQVAAAVTRDHFLGLLNDERAAHVAEIEKGRANADTWQENLEFIAAGLKRAQATLREVEKRGQEVETRLLDAQAQLGQAQGGSVFLRDVVVDLLATAGATLEVEYLVGAAGWAPQYDLRTAADARSVELAYRAQVWQRTGEDWRDCALVLSTAQPQRGAQGPDPYPLTVRPQTPAADLSRSHLTGRGREDAMKQQLEALGYVGDDAPASAAPPPYFTSVESQGLSVQFRLPRRETIESRDRPSTVLIGSQALEASPEHVVAPALDTTVWLRGRTRNTTPWVMLPGQAAVYFGADFIGRSSFEKPVLPDQEFVLHLGADPGVSCERIQVADLREEPGFLSKRQSRTLSWRVTLENHGAHPAEADGSVVVIVREAIPRPADDRIEVEVQDESARPSTDERWRKDHDELGLRTWLLRVAKGGKADLTWSVRTTWPMDLAIETGP